VGHEQREDDEQSEMAGSVHRLYFLPTAMSNASSTASMLRQARDDHEGVAVLVRDRNHVAAARAGELGQEVRQADAEVRHGREPDQDVGELEWKDAPLDPQPEGKHQREHDEQRDPLLVAPEPQMSAARDEPGRDADEIGVGVGAVGRGRSASSARGWHSSLV
jgi:hypothetical protein